MKMKNLTTLYLICISLTMFSQTENSESESHFKPFSIYVNGGLGHRLDDSFAGVKEFKMGYKSEIKKLGDSLWDDKLGKGLNYEFLKKESGLTMKQIKEVETGNPETPIETFFKYAEAIGAEIVLKGFEYK